MIPRAPGNMGFVPNLPAWLRPGRWVQAAPANSRERGQLLLPPLIFRYSTFRSRPLHSQNCPPSLKAEILVRHSGGGLRGLLSRFALSPHHRPAFRYARHQRVGKSGRDAVTFALARLTPEQFRRPGKRVVSMVAVTQLPARWLRWHSGPAIRYASRCAARLDGWPCFPWCKHKKHCVFVPLRSTPISLTARHPHFVSRFGLGYKVTQCSLMLTPAALRFSRFGLCGTHRCEAGRWHPFVPTLATRRKKPVLQAPGLLVPERPTHPLRFCPLHPQGAAPE